MMRILSIIHYPVFGGPHNCNMRIAPILEKKGVETIMLLPEEPGNGAAKLMDAGITVVQLPLTRLRATHDLRIHAKLFATFFSQIRDIRKIMKELHIDIVQLNGLVNPHGAIAARGLDIPVVWQILDSFTPKLLRLAISPLVQHYADAVMSTGQRVADMHPGVNKHADRLVTFFPPVDTSIFRFDQVARANARKQLRISDDALIIGTIGNINTQKGHDNFIRAAANFNSLSPGTKFLVLGVVPDNHRQYVDSLLELARQLGLKVGQNLIILDPTDKVHEWVQAMDIFWMTSRPDSEGIPTAMEEAMAIGLPVVTFDAGSIVELVKPAQAGYVIYGQNFIKLSECTFENLLDQDVRKKMGENGCNFVRKYASLSACAERHMLAYKIARRNVQHN